MRQACANGLIQCVLETESSTLHCVPQQLFHVGVEGYGGSHLGIMIAIYLAVKMLVKGAYRRIFVSGTGA